MANFAWMTASINVCATAFPIGGQRDAAAGAIGLEGADGKADSFVLAGSPGFGGLEGVLAGGELDD